MSIELKINAPPAIMNGVICSCSSKNEKMQANSDSIERISDALDALVYFWAAVCSRNARQVETAIRYSALSMAFIPTAAGGASNSNAQNVEMIPAVTICSALITRTFSPFVPQSRAMM